MRWAPIEEVRPRFKVIFPNRTGPGGLLAVLPTVKNSAVDSISYSREGRECSGAQATAYQFGPPFTGGTEAGISQLGLGGFAVMKALTTRNEEPEKASRPFDGQRDGFVPAEGAVVLILESLEHC